MVSKVPRLLPSARPEVHIVLRKIKEGYIDRAVKNLVSPASFMSIVLAPCGT